MNLSRDKILELAKAAGFGMQHDEHESNLWGGKLETDNLIRYTELVLKENNI